MEDLLLNKGKAKASLNGGLVLLNEGILEQALEHFKESISLEPKAYEPYYYASKILFHKQEYSEAIKTVNNGINNYFNIINQN